MEGGGSETYREGRRKGERQEGREEEKMMFRLPASQPESLLKPQQGTETLSPECDRHRSSSSIRLSSD